MVALRRLVPRSLLLAGGATVAAYGGGHDGGDGGDPFDQLLDLVPGGRPRDPRADRPAETESSFGDPREALVTRDLLTIVG